MTLSIIETKLDKRTRVKLLLKNAVPVYWPCLYILKKMRARSPNTQQRFLSDLIFFYSWLNSEHINIEERLKQPTGQKYLDANELARLTSQSHWKKKLIDQKAQGVRIHPTAYQQVSAEQAISRINSIKSYLAFLYEYLGRSDDRTKHIEWMAKCLSQSTKDIRPSWKRRLSVPKGLSENQEETILVKLQPDSDENPWPQNKALRVRNYLIVMLLYSLGIRRGEMLGIKLSDINYQNNSVSIVHRPNDPDDNRKSEPLIKTNERILSVPDYLMTHINYYIEHYRNGKKAKYHPYLLISYGKGNGSPLSIKAIDAIFNTVRKNFPNLEGITPHSFRHHNVFRTLESIAEQTKNLPIEDRMEREKRALAYKFGWSDTSEMPNLYGQKYYQEEASRALAKRNDQLLGKLNEHKESK
ncbi:tyrosine-type recombinase/integrase [Saccharospirillum sp. HFRX-1]|uniref:tyrosine-type recombinase/integrase n=1 Tax=unclassified Saccharospirillum TaxID=2633430 RepID=UPI00371DEBCE